MEVFSSSCPFDHLPLEMLQYILSYVGGTNSRKDLLACRLVCTLWNQIALKLLTPFGLHITLNQLIRWRFYKTPSSLSPSGGADVGGGRYFILSVTDEIYTRLRKQQGKSLHDLVHGLGEIKYPITIIKFLEPASIPIQSFWKLLKLTSRHLKELHLHLGLESSSPTAYIGEEDQPTIFPQITTICGNMGITQPSSLGVTTCLNLLAHLIQASPNLNSIKLRDERPESWSEEKQTKVLVLLNKISSSNGSSNLEELELCIYGQTNFNSLRSITFSELQSLHISQPMSSNYAVRIEFGLFLLNNCCRLTRLYVHVLNDNLEPWQFDHQAHIDHFPFLPNLKHVGFSCDSNRAYIRNLKRCLEIMTIKFTSLETVTMDLQTCLELSSSNLVDERIPLTFPTVSKLILRVGVIDGFMMIVNRANKNLIRIWFPALQELIIDPAYKLFSRGDWENDGQAASEALNNFWSMEGIKKLEFKNNSYVDWLAELLKCSPSTRDIRETSQQLRLRFTNKRMTDGQGDDVDDDDNVAGCSMQQQDHQNPAVFLNSIYTAFPNLHLLQIDEEILRFNGRFSTEEVLQEVRSWKDLHPGVVFELC